MLSQPADRIPASAGIGLRAPHFRQLLDTLPPVGWLEAHSENYFGAGGLPLKYLEALRAHYPLSLHGVGLSLGSTDALSGPHLDRLKQLIERFQPGLVSEHLSWSSVEGVFLNDLLPLPYTEEALQHVCARIDEVQSVLGRRVLIENPSSYLAFCDSVLSEPEFLSEMTRRTGCGLLLDINNVFVSAHNLGWDAGDYLAQFPLQAVAEVHLAGHAINKTEDDVAVYIDDHGDVVADGVWQLYRATLEPLADCPVLIEWDTRIPALEVLLAQAYKAQDMLEQVRARVA